MTGCQCPDHPTPCHRIRRKRRRVCSWCADTCPSLRRPVSPTDIAILSALVDGGTYKYAGHVVGRSEQAVKRRTQVLRDRYSCPSTIALVWMLRDTIDAHRVAPSAWTAA